MKIANIFFNNNYKIRSNFKGFKRNLNTPISDRVSFSGKSTKQKVLVSIGEDNFPSKTILENYKAQDRSLYEIHLDYYRDLLDCENLDEAKEIFPEFKDVIDAKDIDIKSIDKRHFIYKVFKEGFEGLNLENLTLELLKRYYGKALKTNCKENYFGVSGNTIYRVFKFLNIPLLDKRYTLAMKASNSEFKNSQQDKAIKAWEADDGTRRAQTSEASRRMLLEKWETDDGSFREKMRNIAYSILLTPENKLKAKITKQTDEYRKKQSDIQNRIWEADDGTRRKERSEQVKRTWRDDNGTRRAQLSTLSKQRWDENLRKAFDMAWKLHPEFSKTMSSIAKDFPLISVANEHYIQGISTIKEDKYRMKYYKACSSAMSGYMKIIGEEVKRIYAELKAATEEEEN